MGSPDPTSTAAPTPPADPSADDEPATASVAQLEADNAALRAQLAAAQNPSTEPEPAPQPTEAQSNLKAGSLVSVTTADPYDGTGAKLTAYGIVVGTEETGASVAWLREVSDPVPLTSLDPLD